MMTQTHNKGLAVDLRSGKTITLSLPGVLGVDSEKLCIKITLEAKNGQVARLNIVAPPAVKIGLP